MKLYDKFGMIFVYDEYRMERKARRNLLDPHSQIITLPITRKAKRRQHVNQASSE